MKTAALLIASRDTGKRPWVFILISWLFALPEYCLAAPVNRIGHVAHGGRSPRRS